LALIIALAVGTGAAKTQNVKGHFFRSSIGTEIDANNDGVPASLALGIVNTNRGRFTAKIISEFLLSLSN